MGSNLYDSVLLVRSSDQEIKGFGTGFAIYRDEQATYIVTCAHVIRDVGGPEKVTASGRLAQVIALGSKDGIEGIDLAVLRVEGLPDNLPLLRLSTSVQKGKEFAAPGFQSYPLYGKSVVEFRALYGLIGEATKVGLVETKLIPTWDLKITGDFLLASGYSGSPVVDIVNNVVVGVVISMRDGGRKGTAVPPETLAEIWPEMQASIFRPEPVSKDTFSIAVANIFPKMDLGSAPHIENFHGRDKELTILRRQIVDDHCKVVAILGIGGIGKTTLARKLVQHIRDKFEYVFWRSLQNAQPLGDVLSSCILFLSDQQMINIPANVNYQIEVLIKYIQNHRCLLILDNMETVLQGGNRVGLYREGYEEYGKLIQLVGEASHQSCLLLTSREKPKEISLLEGKTSPVRGYHLLGLKLKESQRLLKDKDLFGTGENWKTLVNHYSGNPLALKMVSTIIKDVFRGNIYNFLIQDTMLLDNISDLLHHQFDRLSSLEKTVMYWLAIEREPTSLEDLQKNFVHQLSSKEFLESVASLIKRHLIEQNEKETLFTLQPVVMEYITDQLVEQVIEEINCKKIILLKSHALIKAQSKDYIRDSQLRIIVKPIFNAFTEETLENNLKEILEILREKFSSLPGYAGGNLLNLLLQLKKGSLNNLNFSGLVIWQAHLQSMQLHNVDFSHTDLSLSTFTQSFSSTHSVVFSPNGEYLVTGQGNGEIRLWQLLESKHVISYIGHIDWIRALAFSADGHTLASGSDDQTIRLWDVGTGRCLNKLKAGNGRVSAVVFSLDNLKLITGSDDQTIRLWDVYRGRCLKVFHEHTGPVWSIALNPDGRTLASGGEDQTIKLWDVDTGQCLKTFRGHTNWVWSVAFSPDGHTLASGSYDHTVKLWDVDTGQCLKTFQGHTNWVWSVAFSPDGRILASGSDDQTIRLWGVDTGHCLKTCRGHTNRIWSVAFSPDGRTLASGSDDQTIRLWDVDTGQCLKTFQGYTSQIWSVAFNSDRHILASGGEDQTIRLWDVDTGQCLKIFRGHTNRIWSVAFSPDGRTLASGGEDQTIKLWDVDTGQCLKTFQGHSNQIWSVAFSPDGRTLASGGEDQTIKLWDVDTGQCLKTFQGHTNWVWSVAFSPDGRTLASGSYDHTVKLWDTRTGQCLNTLIGHTNLVLSVAFSPDGYLLASGSYDHTVKLWDTRTGQCLDTLRGHLDSLWSIAFSPDGSMLISGGVDRKVNLWNVKTGQCVKTFEGHTHSIITVAFSPNGYTIASGGQDEIIQLWNIHTGKRLKTLRIERPYEGINITGVKGLTESQKVTLKTLGAIEN